MMIIVNSLNRKENLIFKMSLINFDIRFVCWIKKGGKNFDITFWNVLRLSQVGSRFREQSEDLASSLLLCVEIF